MQLMEFQQHVKHWLLHAVVIPSAISVYTLPATNFAFGQELLVEVRLAMMQEILHHIIVIHYVQPIPLFLRHVQFFISLVPQVVYQDRQTAPYTQVNNSAIGH
jgi:hypothetical protein